MFSGMVFRISHYFHNIHHCSYFFHGYELALNQPSQLKAPSYISSLKHFLIWNAISSPSAFFAISVTKLKFACFYLASSRLWCGFFRRFLVSPGAVVACVWILCTDDPRTKLENYIAALLSLAAVQWRWARSFH